MSFSLGRNLRQPTLALTLAFGALEAVGCGGFVSSDAGSGGATTDGSGGAGIGGSATGGGDSGGSDAGGSDSGGQVGSGGATSSGGNGGTGGDCGPCPGVACGPPLMLTVSSESEEGTVNMRELTADAEGITVDCQLFSGCAGECIVQDHLPDGHYSVALSAAGVEPVIVEFDIVNPTNCGCCGCCPGSHSEQIVMVPNPDATSDNACCALLDSDTSNCGTCGHLCQDFEACVSGNCVPTP